MRYLKLVGLWISGLAMPILVAWFAAEAGSDAVTKIMFSVVVGYTVLWVIGCLMKLVMNTSLDKIGGWSFGVNLIALSIGGADFYFGIGTSVGILAGWYMLDRSKAIRKFQGST